MHVPRSLSVYNHTPSYSYNIIPVLILASFAYCQQFLKTLGYDYPPSVTYVEYFWQLKMFSHDEHPDVIGPLYQFWKKNILGSLHWKVENIAKDIGSNTALM